MPDFVLDPRLEGDSLPVTDLPLSTVRLSRDANYPWLIAVPRRAGLVEIIDLGETDRAVLMEEVARLSQVLRQTVRCDKLNVAALGNSVAQLHVHVIARCHDDAAWPNPIWGAEPPKAYADGVAEALAAELAARLK